MNAAEKAEALASIRQDLGGVGLGLVLGAVACYFVRPKNKATNALEMAQRWLAWGLLGSVSSGISFWVRNYDKGGIFGGLITIFFFSALAWGLGYVWGLIKFPTTTPADTNKSGTASGPHGGVIVAAVVGVFILGLVALSATKSGETSNAGSGQPGGGQLRVPSEEPMETKSFAELDAAAQEGDEFAQLVLGWNYIQGWDGQEPDAEKGIELIRKTAETGSMEAQAVLATCYSVGHGVPRNYLHGEAIRNAAVGDVVEDPNAAMTFAAHKIKWLHLAAEEGNAYAQFTLGSTAKADDAAAKWMTMAAEQGLAPAQRRLGEMYREGKGVTRDAEQGFQWLIKAALQGSTAAKREVGSAFFWGEGTGQNQKEGVKWLLEAASEGDTVAPRILGIAYKNGDGVTKDTKAALAWLYVANASSDDMPDNVKVHFNQMAAELEGTLGRDGTLQAQELAKTLVPEKPATAATN